MSFTRFHDDPARIQSQLQIQTGTMRYMLGSPGVGAMPHYVSDPSVRMQGWAGQVTCNPADVESDLKGLTRTTTRGVERGGAVTVLPEIDRSHGSIDRMVGTCRVNDSSWEVGETENARHGLLGRPNIVQCGSLCGRSSRDMARGI